MTLHELSVCILRTRSGNLSFFFRCTYIINYSPSVHTPLYARTWLQVHVFIVNRSMLFFQSGRGTGLQYHKGQWLFAYCIRDRAMNSRTHKPMRIYKPKSRWYTRAKAGAAPYPKGLRKYRGVRICKYIYALHVSSAPTMAIAAKPSPTCRSACRSREQASPQLVAQSQQRVHVCQIEAIFGPVRRSTRARGLCHPGTFSRGDG